jgi:hypothetical protein
MSLDLILHATTKAQITALLTTRGLLDVNGNPIDGFTYCWWAEGGQLMTAKPSTYLAGFVMLARIHSSLFDSDVISEGPEQWQRSKIAKFIKTNGTPGTLQGINFYLLSNVRLFRAADVLTFLATNSLPGHEWAGGNSL